MTARLHLLGSLWNIVSSRSQIQQYVRELNSLESRRGRKPLDVNNVVYWFKNARAAQKRAEIRSGAPGELELGTRSPRPLMACFEMKMKAPLGNSAVAERRIA